MEQLEWKGVAFTRLATGMAASAMMATGKVASGMTATGKVATVMAASGMMASGKVPTGMAATGVVISGTVASRVVVTVVLPKCAVAVVALVAYMSLGTAVMAPRMLAQHLKERVAIWMALAVKALPIQMVGPPCFVASLQNQHVHS